MYEMILSLKHLLPCQVPQYRAQVLELMPLLRGCLIWTA